MKKTTLSLGIPVYNQASTIEETINSVLSQSERFDEIIVSDNHSTDGTSEILKLYLDRITLVMPLKHLRMVENYNFCVSHMNGEWFSLLSGDDLLKKDFSSEVRKAATLFPNASMIRTDWDWIDEYSQIKRTHYQMSVSRMTPPPKNWIEQLYGPKIGFASFAARRDLWRLVGGFPEEFHLWHDWMFYLKMAPLGEFIRIPKALGQYRVQDRPALEESRSLLRVEDEHRYLVDFLPTLPWRNINHNSKKIIKRVRQRRFIDLLNHLVHYPSALDEKRQELLLSIASTSDMVKMYQVWLVNTKEIKNNKNIILSNLKIYFRNIISDIFFRLR